MVPYISDAGWPITSEYKRKKLSDRIFVMFALAYVNIFLAISTTGVFIVDAAFPDLAPFYLLAFKTTWAFFIQIFFAAAAIKSASSY